MLRISEFLEILLRSAKLSLSLPAIETTMLVDMKPYKTTTYTVSINPDAIRFNILVVVPKINWFTTNTYTF